MVQQSIFGGVTLILLQKIQGVLLIISRVVHYSHPGSGLNYLAGTVSPTLLKFS
uniref:Uncharacterized protein n=1 Tax=Anguilla anguilla TaxID=7936 RepID=A0A0E9Q8S6_ANGAN